MPTRKSVRILDHFARLTDPRRPAVTYPLINVVVIAICAVICGADDFVAIARFGRTKRAWFERLLDLRASTPSHDRFNAVFRRHQASRVREMFLELDDRVARIDRRTSYCRRPQDVAP